MQSQAQQCTCICHGGKWFWGAAGIAPPFADPDTQSRDIHIQISAAGELEEAFMCSTSAPSLDRWGKAQKHDFPPSSYYSVAKPRTDGKSLGTCHVLFALNQHFTNFSRHVNHPGNCGWKAKSESLHIGWNLCSYISRKFLCDAKCWGTMRQVAKLRLHSLNTNESRNLKACNSPDQPY